MDGMKLIYESTHSLIYLRTDEGVHHTIVKMARNTLPGNRQLFFLQREYIFTQQLSHIPGVREAFKETTYQNQYAIELAYIPGKSLKEAFIKNRKSIAEILSLFIDITTVLQQIHASNIIHKDLTSHNILISEDTEGHHTVHIIDFALAAYLEENALIDDNTKLWATEVEQAGTWAYMAPEQTGNGSYHLSFGTDLYALGINLYEMLTGHHPFEAQTAVEWLHAHLAQEPENPKSFNSHIPDAVAAVCLKLLEKNPQKRYLSAKSLQRDIFSLQEKLQQNQTKVAFTPGKSRRGANFQLSEKFINRQAELKKLHAALQDIQEGGFQIGFISGYAGMGKTALARNIKPAVKEMNGYFLEGRFDPLTRHLPYSAWLQVFEAFTNQIITEKSSQLETWKAIIQQSVGNNGKLLTDVLPRLELIIGKQPAIEKIRLDEAQNRLNYVFQRFIDAISVASHPLVLFLDDWQWADPASIDLLKIIAYAEQNDYFMVLGTYREMDDSDQSIGSATLKGLAKSSAQPFYIRLTNLSQADVNLLIQDTLGCEADACEPLTKIVYQKTQGNPFFVGQMLRTLFDKEMLSFDAGEWQYDTTAIAQMAISENVAEWLSAHLKTLSEPLQKLLQYAACVGEKFSINILSYLLKLPQHQLQSLLSQLIEERLIIATTRGYKFAHNRLRAVCYELIPSADRSALHVRVGLWMVTHLAPQTQEDSLFEIVNHLNLGKHLLKDAQWLDRYNFDILQLINLNLKAAHKSQSSGALENAKSYLQNGIDLLPEDKWQTLHATSYQLYCSLAEISYLLGDTVLSKEMAREALTNTSQPLDQAYLYNMLIIQANAEGAYKQSYYMGKEALRLLGFVIRDEASEVMLAAKRRTVGQMLDPIEIDQLIHRPGISNPYIRYAVILLTNMEYAAKLGFSEMIWSIIVYKALFLCLKYGNIPESAYIYAVYGRLLLQKEAHYKEAYQFGSLAVGLCSNHHHPAISAKVFAQYGGNILPWARHLRHAPPILEEGFQMGLEGGDLKAAAENFVFYIGNLLAQGLTLSNVLKHFNEYISYQHQLKEATAYPLLCHYFQHITRLMGVKDDTEQSKWMLNTAKPSLSSDPSENDVICSILDIQQAYFKQDHQQVITLSKKTIPFAHRIQGKIEHIYLRLFYALSLTATFDKQSPSAKNKLIQTIIEQEKELQIWAQQAPENFGAISKLVYAEILKIRQDFWKAGQLYDEAILEARQNGFMHWEALGNELAAVYWMATGKQDFAKTYFEKAAYLYDRWGAKPKCHQLKGAYPQFFHTQASVQDTTSSIIDVDNITLLQASQTLSSEIVLSNLLEQLLRILITNAGAVNGAFFTAHGQNIVLKAEGNLKKGIDVAKTQPLSQAKNVPQSIIRYVARTLDELVLEDACREELYTQDPYIQSYEILSVACLPIIYQEKLSAVIYLDNPLMGGAFTNERLKVLRILSSQIAISLENASLYENLEEKVTERTRELDEKNKKLSQTLNQLKDTQAQLVDAAKMASLGQLTAGIAHEINNPLNFISANINPLQLDFQDLKSLYDQLQNLTQKNGSSKELAVIKEYVEEIDIEFIFEEIDSLLKGIAEGAHRTQTIVEGLRAFSHGGEKTFQHMDVHEGIDATLMLLKNALKQHITVHKQYGDLPRIQCMPGKINQVFMNILHNAILAIEEKIELGLSEQGNITISTQKSGVDQVRIDIQDDGKGIEEHIVNRIFEPFFTTRDVGKGTGLGLSISFGIIEQHGGKIEVQSQLHEGACFRIFLPIDQPEV